MMGFLFVFVVVGLIVVVGLVSVMYAQNRRFLAESRWWVLRRRKIEDVLQKRYPHVLVLPAWNVFPATGRISYTVAENPDETPEQVAARIVAEVESKRARGGTVAAEDLC